MTSRVREVSLRVRVPSTLAVRRDELRRAAADELIAPVLEELERRFHARFGRHAILRVRALRVSWRVATAELAADDIAVRLADDLADELFAQLDARTGPERLRPRDRELAAFVDREHAIAAFLADSIDERGGEWVHAGMESTAATWADVIDRGAAPIVSVLRWLAKMERVEEVLATTPDAIIDRLAAIVPHDQQPPVLARAVAQRREHEANVRQREHRPARAATRPEQAPERPAARTDASDRDAMVPHVDASPSAPVPPPTSDSQAAMVETRHAGLFYLIGRVLEIDLAERLWATGLPEGDVLAHVAAAIVGDDADPASRWFGGVFDRPPLAPVVAPWAVAEMRLTMHALGARLAHFEIETTPARLDRELERLASELPPRADVDAGLARVISRAAAALVALTAARLRAQADAPGIRAVCERPGLLELREDALVVTLPSAVLDLDHRRAGLDHDPGHVPWLRRALRFEFVGVVAL